MPPLEESSPEPPPLSSPLLPPPSAVLPHAPEAGEKQVLISQQQTEAPLQPPVQSESWLHDMGELPLLLPPLLPLLLPPLLLLLLLELLLPDPASVLPEVSKGLDVVFEEPHAMTARAPA